MVDNKSDAELTLFLKNERSSKQFAIQLANFLPQAAILTLSGEIGSGKTTLIRAILKQLGVTTSIKSPTFSLVESYQCLGRVVHHFDLYRINHEDELEYIGFRDYIGQDSLCFIEWPEQAGDLLPPIDIKINLKIERAGRRLQLLAFTAIGKHILSGLKGPFS
ncbi:MAG: tRNA (adenosine(37)-N6)-threonylcarbamoyltransferase complex ATPase subunit type 1 TsaE [Legionella sp.]|nr:tRNA (adenosine(37)-N6)-threonylcarbamoyltransferase complex ATPase subunit type 1 TsaE [Legionella sp.]